MYAILLLNNFPSKQSTSLSTPKTSISWVTMIVFTITYYWTKLTRNSTFRLRVGYTLLTSEFNHVNYDQQHNNHGGKRQSTTTYVNMKA